MAQNRGGSGYAKVFIKVIGGILLISGVGNFFMGEGPGSVIVTIIGLILLLGKSGGKAGKSRPTPRTAAKQQQVSRQVKETVQQNIRPLVNTGARSAGSARQACPNPEPHRHFELQQQPPASQVEQMVKNRKTLYEAGLLTREEYDSEVRKLRGR